MNIYDEDGSIKNAGCVCAAIALGFFVVVAVGAAVLIKKLTGV